MQLEWLFFSHIFSPEINSLSIGVPPLKYFLPQASNKCIYNLQTKIVPLTGNNN